MTYLGIATQPKASPRTRIESVTTRRRARTLRSPWSLPALPWARYAYGLMTTAVCTVAVFPIGTRVDLINIVMVYMLGSTAAGLWLGRGPSAMVAGANVLAFDFFFVPPRFSFYVADASYLITFGAMLVVALVISNLVVAVRRQTESARTRERHTAALYAITRDLADIGDARAMAQVAVQRIARELHCFTLILMCGENDQLDVAPVACSDESHPQVDFIFAQRVASHGQQAAPGMPQRGTDAAMYLRLVGAGRNIGVLVAERVEPNGVFLPEQQRLLEACAAQLACALQRARLAEMEHAARMAAESAAMRNTLLASISHDLRTPLSAIAGAGSIVRSSEFALDIYRRATLGKLIEDKARDMSDLLSNILDLVKLESGSEVLTLDWHNLEDLVGLALQRNEGRLAGWDVNTDIAEDLPMVALDSTLFVQLLSNLLENATKYTPPGTHITISATRDDVQLRIAVEDDGPGWGMTEPERLFEKFSRGKVESTTVGVGLGLTICRVIAHLHGGEIRASSSRQGGARFEIDLPTPMEDARLEAAAAEA